MRQDEEQRPQAHEAGATSTAEQQVLSLTTRRQVPRTTGRQGWRIVEQTVDWPPAQTAIVIVDMWDVHWSRGASERVNVLAPRIDAVTRAARRRGVRIIHAPSDVVDAYKDHAARQAVLRLPQVTPPEPAAHADPPLPIDDSDEGSDTGEPRPFRAWSRQHPAIEIADGDAISADGHEVYSLLAHTGIKNLIFMGVHTNMCVLRRSFAIKAMVRWRVDVVLARDLTDAMYNPLMPPYVSHDEGTQLVVGYIEKFWCPTILSDDLTATWRP